MMKRITRVLVGALAAAMLSASAAMISAAPVTFTDVSDHWAKNYISYLVDKEVLNGYKQNDGTSIFKPEDKVTRAEFIKMLDETFGLTEMADITGKYNDVKQEDWFYQYFAKAAAQGYIHNYGNTATPNGALSREEATSLLVRYLNLPDEEMASASQFADYSQISSYYNQDVLKAVQAALINGYKEDNGTYTFRPKNTLTRAEALTILYRAAGAIYTANRSDKDTAAFQNNAVVKKGGLTLTSQTLDGRVIISEGADSGTIFFERCNVNDTLYIRGGANITLSNTTIKNVVVDSPDIITISVQNSSKIDNLIINERCNVMIGQGTTVKTLTVNENAPMTAITGTGAIENATILATGFSSTMVPHVFEIREGLLASFASREYQGLSTAQDAFGYTPFMTIENGVHCINVLSLESGFIRYYFTNSDYCPTISEFGGYYAASSYKSSFEVKKNSSETEYTYSSDYVSSYGYIVLQLQSDGRYFPPVCIPNEDSSGSGFSTDPYLSSIGEVKYTANSSGIVYYMYSPTGTEMNINDFILAYDEQSSELKGENAGKHGNISINVKYADKNRYMVLMYKSASGLYHTPVVVALGTNGFTDDPVVTTPGSILCKPGVKGTLYYYYSPNANLPAPDKFNAEWKAAEYSESVAVESARSLTLTYKTNLTDEYPYMILCIREGGDEYLMPVALKIDYDSGFDTMPEVINESTIRFEPSYNGKIYYYYTKSQQAPDTTGFMEKYRSVATSLRGTKDARSSSFDNIAYSPANASTYSYMAIMAEDANGNKYQPVVVSLKTTDNTGFTVFPYVYGSEIYFKTNYDCEVWYYYARTNDAVPSSEFYERWYAHSWGGSTVAKSGESKSITYDKDLLDNFPYIVFATSKDDRTDVFTYPIIVDVKSAAKEDYDAAVRVTGVAKQNITVTAYENGDLYYYETNTATAPSKSGFNELYFDAETSCRGYKAVNAGDEGIKLPVSGKYKYMVLQLEYETASGSKVSYKPIVVSLREETGSTTTPNNPTSTDYGFVVHSIDTTECIVTLSADYNGTLKFSFASEDGTPFGNSEAYDIYLGKEVSFRYPYNPGLEKLGYNYLVIQLIDESGVTHRAYTAKIS